MVVVGAGLSGIGAGHHLAKRCPWASFAILEARERIGGTWDLFRYPGIRSDSDMFTLGYPFRPWDGDKAIADGASIRQYIEQTAAESGLVGRIRFQRRVVAADWSSADARWLLTVECTDTGERQQLSCSWLFACTGYYRYDRGHLPDFPGLERFEGRLVHPQHWPDDIDHAGKRIVVIGSGATAVTLVPALAAQATKVTMLQRSPSYIASLPAVDPLANALRRRLPARLAAPTVRWTKALTTQASYRLARRWPAAVKALLRAQARFLLPNGFDIDTHFTPRYDPWDQRLCVVPDGDLFRALRDGTADVVTDRIDTFTAAGIRLASGRHLDADIVVSATGLELLFLGGIRISVDGDTVDPATRLAYKGMMLEGVPNLSMAVGYTNASWTLKCDLTCDHVVRLLGRMRSAGLRQATPVNPDPSVSAQPLLGLSSGYVLRSVDRFPKQGSRDPWRVHQSYLKDYRLMKLRPVDDPNLLLSNPAPGEQRLASAS